MAVKVLPAGDVGELNVARFRNEMRAIGGLRHPNIVTAHDAGEAHGVHYLAMDFVDGVDLARLTRRHERLPAACSTSWPAGPCRTTSEPASASSSATSTPGPGNAMRR